MIKKVSINIVHKSIRLFAVYISCAALILCMLTAPAHADDDTPILPTAIALDAKGVVYMANHDSGQIDCVWADGSRTPLAQGLDRPSAIAVDRLRTVFVGTLSGEVWAITPSGERTLAAKGLPAVLALTIDRDGTPLIACHGGTLVRLAKHSE
ncbi:hypothetical protein GGQ74_001576 [Desulfobaculum xiamenense]|uniref:Uncharacterized protein n=1 Tax=Desulfobaculum xiamenense TaxID=995050 RepID=A0A846QGL2_9BACT|nr:hypothetical protein [Desulfobaculum xiamenense]NJB67936.1 hypothetical protein [Desulfobaculum xiamenense]